MLVPLVVGTPPAPIVRAAPIQDSPIALSIRTRAGTKRITCVLDGHRARTCERNPTFKARPGRHTVAVRALDARGRASSARRVTIIVPARAPAAIRVGGEPVGIAAADGVIWVSGGSSGTVTAVDATTRRVAARVQVGGQLGGVAATADGSAAWVSDFGGGSVVRIDPVHHTVAQRIAVGGQPTALIPQLDGALWVGNLEGYVDRIGPSSRTRILLTSGVSVLLATRGLLWAGLQNGSAVAVDPTTRTPTGSAASVSRDVDAIADSPGGLWVSTFGGTAALVDPDTRLVKRRVKLPSRGSGISVGGGSVWASAYDSALVVRLDPTTGALLGAVHTGAQPRESLVVGNTLWVCNQADGTITPISL